MIISDYPKISALAETDVFLVDTVDGTKIISSKRAAQEFYDMVDKEPVTPPKFPLPTDIGSIEQSEGKRFLLYKDEQYYAINPSDMFYSFFDSFSEGVKNKRLIRRHKNLGSEITLSQAEAIYNGTFKDIYVGDYWVFRGANGTDFEFYVADINYAIPENDNDYPNIILFCPVINSSTDRTVDFSFGSNSINTYDSTCAHFSKLTKTSLHTEAINTLKAKVSPWSSSEHWLIKVLDSYLGYQPSKATNTSSLSKVTAVASYTGIGIVPPPSMLDQKLDPLDLIGSYDDLLKLNQNRWPTLSLFERKGIFTLENFGRNSIILSGCNGYRALGYATFSKISTSNGVPYKRSSYMTSKNPTVGSYTVDETYTTLKFTLSLSFMTPLIFSIGGIGTVPII